MPRATDKLFCVDISGAARDAPVVEEYLTAAGYAVSVTTDPEKDESRARIYCRGPEEAAEARSVIEGRLLPELAAIGIGPGRVTSVVLRARDWTETWKRYFRPVHVTPRLVVVPEWIDYRPRPGEITVRINPGMCFGTGRHGTTRGCLFFLDRIAVEAPGPLSLLDIGCGSGILSMAAWRLGYRPIFAFDSDPDAVRTTRENLDALGARGITVDVRDLAQWDAAETARVVVANILSPVLLAHAERIIASVDIAARPARLILSGIQKHEFPAVRERFEALGFRLRRRRTLRGWTTGCFAPR